MLDKKDKGRLIQIINHCKRIVDITKNISNKEFADSIDIQEIVCFNIFQIGELAKGLSNQLIQSDNQTPWKQIKGMRDIIGHGYGTINIETVWETVVVDVPKLLNHCIKLNSD